MKVETQVQRIKRHNQELRRMTVRNNKKLLVLGYYPIKEVKNK